MTVYIPNIGERLALKAILSQAAVILGLYCNQVVPDGNTIFETLQELPTGNGRGYASKALNNSLLEGNPVADKWSIAIDSSGKAAAQYSNVDQSFLFLQADVDDGNTAYGVFGYVLMVPFSTGSAEIKPGDTVTGVTSTAHAVVVGLVITSGSWGTGDAAGFMFIKTKVGIFQNGENLQVSAATKAVSATGSSGDAQKHLLFVEALSSPIPINTLGQIINYTPRLTASSG